MYNFLPELLQTCKGAKAACDPIKPSIGASTRRIEIVKGGVVIRAIEGDIGPGEVTMSQECIDPVEGVFLVTLSIPDTKRCDRFMVPTTHRYMFLHRCAPLVGNPITFVDGINIIEEVEER